MVDHSREAIQHAQKLANFFVDESRLSDNTYFFIRDEVDAVNKIQNNDPFLVQIPLFQKNTHNKQTIRSEIYVF